MSRARSAGLAAAGVVLAAGGFLMDRRAGTRLRAAGEEEERASPLGGLRGTPVDIRTEDGLRLHAEVDEADPDEIDPDGAGSGHGRVTLVFVHGFALTHDCWHFQRAALRGERRMVFYDQRSHGLSDTSEPEHATIDQLARDLVTVLDTVAPDEPVVLVGHSMGGMTVVALAEQYPELFGDRVLGVALISTTAGGARAHKMLHRWIPDAVGTRVLDRGLAAAAERERLLELFRRSGSGLALKLTEGVAFGDGAVPREYVRFLDRMIGATSIQVLVQFIPQIDALDKFHVVEAFADVPTWVMCGTKDRLTPVDHARTLHARIPGSHLVEFEGAGHIPIFDFADQVNDALRSMATEAERTFGGRARPDERAAR